MNELKCYRCGSWPCECSDGCAVLWGDCRELYSQLPPVDLILTDPPYGIDSHVMRASLPGSPSSARVIVGDDSEESANWLMSIVGDSPAVVFGAANWPHLLPHKGRWICWDKRCDEKADKMLGSAFELAWENRSRGYDTMIRCQHGGVVNADHRRFSRKHPTQKPTKVMRDIITRYSNSQLVCDPFMGGGTTLVAAKQLGRKAIGIEIEERYCEIACNRLANEPMPLFREVVTA